MVPVDRAATIDANATPLVTVVMPAFNAARYVAAALRSALAQSYRNIEVIVVNDGSTDATESIVRGLMEQDPRVQVVTQENLGQEAARLVGVTKATGDFVAFLDADDLWHPRKIGMQVREVLPKPDGSEPAAVYTYFRAIDESETAIWDQYPWHASGFIACRHVAFGVIGAGGSSLMCRTDVLREAMQIVSARSAAGTGFSEDFDLELELASKFRIVCVPKYLVGYRQHAMGTSRDKLKMALGHVAVVQRFLSQFPHSGRACKRYAKGSNLVLELGACLQEKRYRQGASCAIALLVTDPVRFIQESWVRCAGRLIGRRTGASHRGAPFVSLAPDEQSFHLESAFVEGRLQRLQDYESLIGPLDTGNGALRRDRANVPNVRGGKQELGAPPGKQMADRR